MGNRKSAYEEVISLFDQLIKVIPKFVDGKKAILEMKDGGGRNWRQEESVGGEPSITSNVGPSREKSPGPRPWGLSHF